MLISDTRKSDKDLYNNKAEDFIPMVCHYDENTLLTKNGELIQTIQINGVNSEQVSDKLFNLREVVRNAIIDNIKSDNFAFWIHTVRRKTNLDDTTSYKKLLPANVHNLWRAKNFWDDKFVNTLYISIVYDSATIKLTNANGFINSLSHKVIADFHDQYFDHAFKELNSSVDQILSSLKEYGAIKLGIRFKGEDSFSDLMFLCRRIVHLNEGKSLVPIADLSKSLASHKYAVGGDVIEVIDDQGRKFAAMLSIKEYHEVSAEAIDVFLQLPVEMIATEIFYFVDKQQVVPIFQEQHDFLRISGSLNLSEVKGIKDIIEGENNRFCHQQISIAIIGEQIDSLEQDVRSASEELSKIGIVHVREDINLEQTFWAQLPGNFTFIRRTSPTILKNTSALASLHNFPTGEKYNPWGAAVTLLRTEKSTPYFMNIHTKDSEGNNCIFGSSKTGKTVLTNFILSEANKYDPTILYFADTNESQILIEALAGKWLEINEKSPLINPFLSEDNELSRNFIYEFLKIICCHHIDPLNEQELSFLLKLVDKNFVTDVTNRNLSFLLKTTDFTIDGGESLKARFSMVDEGGLYYGIFDSNQASKMLSGDILGINLYNLSSTHFTEKFLPTEEKLVPEFNLELQKNDSVRMGLIYVFSYYFTNCDQKPKILVIDNVQNVICPQYIDNIVSNILHDLSKNNGVMISNFNVGVLKKQKNISEYKKWISLINTSIILPSDINKECAELLSLTQAEINKLLTFDLESRMFLIKQSSQSIAVELSIGGFNGLVKILSAGDADLAVYKEILAQYNEQHPDNWIIPLYESLDAT